MQTIEIDFQVFKEITVRRKNEDTTPNDVLREVFNLELRQKPMTPKKLNLENLGLRKAWYFLTEQNLGSLYKGQMYYARLMMALWFLMKRIFLLHPRRPCQ